MKLLESGIAFRENCSGGQKTPTLDESREWTTLTGIFLYYFLYVCSCHLKYFHSLFTNMMHVQLHSLFNKLLEFCCVHDQIRTYLYGVMYNIIYRPIADQIREENDDNCGDCS